MKMVLAIRNILVSVCGNDINYRSNMCVDNGCCGLSNKNLNKTNWRIQQHNFRYALILNIGFLYNMYGTVKHVT